VEWVGTIGAPTRMILSILNIFNKRLYDAFIPDEPEEEEEIVIEEVPISDSLASKRVRRRKRSSQLKTQSHKVEPLKIPEGVVFNEADFPPLT
jgi:hypothetical protein